MGPTVPSAYVASAALALASLANALVGNHPTLATLEVTLGGLSPLRAHHGSFISYDRDKQWTAQATVTEFRYVNPHAQLFFDVKDKDGNTTVDVVAHDEISEELGGAGGARVDQQRHRHAVFLRLVHDAAAETGK